MPKEYSRTQRVADLIQHELAAIMQREIEDPSLSLVTITAVTVSPDLSIAKILVTQLNKKQTTEQLIQKLNKLAGFLRYKLAHVIKLRSMPQLKFFYDVSLEKSIHLTSLIDEAVAEDKRKHENEDE